MTHKKITIGSILKNLDAIITCVTLSVCVIVVNINVIFRYFFNSPINGSEEFVTALFVWTVFIGCAYAHRTHAHLGVDILVNLMPEKVRKIVEDVVLIIELLILIMVTVISAQYVYHLMFTRGVWKPVLTDVLRMPKWYFGIAVPIGFGMCTFYSIRELLVDKFHLIKKKPAEKLAEQEEGAV